LQKEKDLDLWMGTCKPKKRTLNKINSSNSIINIDKIIVMNSNKIGNFSNKIFNNKIVIIYNKDIYHPEVYYLADE